MRFLIGDAVAAVIVVVGVTGALVACGDGGDTPGCAQAEEALRPWAGAMSEVYGNLPADISPKPSDRAAVAAFQAQTADDIRAGADLVESASLRAEVHAVADAFDAISHSMLAPASATPSKEYFGATTRMNEALHAIAKVCPGIGEPSPPPVRP
ncbi:hypothetical protein [Mycolicibacterium sp. XJ1819]